ncbi:sensor histidine kinase [Streptomyces hoynatensis]|nr:ATP-binding protein [Streptomyces hoynatensis]
MEWWALLAGRAAALLNVGVALGTGAGGGQVFVLAAALAAALALESAALVAAFSRWGRLPQWAGWLDLAVSCAALVANAALVHGQDVHTWGFFAYPYTLVASIACGVLLRGPWRIGAAPVCLAVVYAVSDHLSSGQPWPNAVPNAASYLGIAPVVGAVAWQLRRMAAELDSSRAVAAELAAREAVVRERSRHARLLHDRVLQTLETLGKGAWIADPWMRDQVRAEAGWLRWLVERGPEAVRVDGQVPAERAAPDGQNGHGGQAEAAGLEAGLQALAQERVRQGLRVTVNLPPAGADFSRVPGPVADALLGACYEALTNVGKHAGVDRATIWAAVDGDEAVVGVVDQGSGFEPAARPERAGLSRSIRGRMAEVGGTVLVDSAPGEGTSVELRAPLPPPPVHEGG